MAVESVQQALADLDYDLGPTGVDGDYGQRTWSAVKQFKKNERLGWEHMGDVGPGTMQRLDEIFENRGGAGGVVVGPRDDEKVAPCPTDEYVTAAVADTSSIEGRPSLGEDIEPATACEPDAAPTIWRAVACFKERVRVKDPPRPTELKEKGVGYDVPERGQFFWAGLMYKTVQAELADIQNAGFRTEAIAASDGIWNNAPAADTQKRLMSLDRKAQTSDSEEKWLMLNILADKLASSGTDAAMFELRLWRELNQSSENALPVDTLAKFQSLRTQHALHQFDNVGCGIYIDRIVRRLKARGGGLRPRDRSVPPFAAFLPSGGRRDRRPIDPKHGVLKNYHLGDHIFQENVPAVVDGLRQALRAGQIIHARVLSGVGYGTVPYVPPEPKARPHRLGMPPDEHSILIIGFEGQNNFVFHDPDAGVSHDPERGFGMLYYDPGPQRLSTALTEDQLFVDAHGFHQNGNKRYQVISLGAMPG